MKERIENVVIVSDILENNASMDVVKEFEDTVIKSLPFFSNHNFNFFHMNIHQNLDGIKTPTTALFLESIDCDFMKRRNIVVSVTKGKQISETREFVEELIKLEKNEKSSKPMVNGDEKEKFIKKWGAVLF